MALDDTKKRTFSGGQPPTDGISNKHDGAGDVDMGEKLPQNLLVEGNRFPRQKRTKDNLSAEEAVLGP